MPVFEQGYRRYAGERSTRSRAFAMAWENVRPRMRPWVWLLLLVLLLWPYLVYAVMMFVATMGASMFGSPRMLPTAPSLVAFEQGRQFNPATVLGLVQGNSLGLFWELLDKASAASVILPAVVGAGLLASDRRTGALQIYFARPVTRLQYLTGKVIAATFLVALTTVVPCLFLWGESVAFGSSANFTWRTWIAPLVIVGASGFYALWTLGLVLSLSAVMKRPAIVAILAIFLDLAAEGVGNVLAAALREKSWHVIQPSYAIGSMTAGLCGLDLPPWINGYAAFAIAFAVPMALLAFVWWRVRAVEVVT